MADNVSASSVRGSKAYITIQVMDEASQHIKTIRKEYADLVARIVQGSDLMAKAQGRAVSGYKHLAEAAREAAAAAKGVPVPGGGGGGGGGGRPPASAAAAAIPAGQKHLENFAAASRSVMKSISSAAGIAATAVQSLGQAFNTAGASIVSAGSAMASFGSAAAQVGLAGTSAFAIAAKMAGDYEKIITRIQALTGANTADMAALRDTIKQVGLDSGLGATEAAKAAERLALAGIEGSEAIGKALRAATALQRLGDANAEQASTILADTAVAFRATPRQFDAISAAIVEGSRRSTSSITNFGDALKYASNGFAEVGGSFSELIAVLSTTGALKGTLVGTDIPAILRNITDARAQLAEFDESGGDKSMKEKAAAAKALGLEMTKLNSKGQVVEASFVDIITRLKELEKGAEKAGTSLQFRTNLSLLFRENSKTIQALLGNFDILKKNVEDISKVGGPDLRALTSGLDEGDANAVDKLKAAFEDMALTVGKELLPIIKQVADAVRSQIAPMAEWLKNNANQVRSLAAAFVALFVSGTALGIVSKIVTGIGTAFTIVGGIIGTVGTVMSLTITGITALADNIGKAAGSIGNFVGGIFALIPGFQGAAVGAKVASTVISTALVPSVVAVVYQFGKAFFAALDFSKSLETIKATAVESFGVIVTKGREAFNAIGDALSTGNFTQALDVFKAYVVTVWDEIVADAKVAFYTLAGDIQSAFITAFGTVEDFIVNTMRHTGNLIFQALTSAVAEAVKAMARVWTGGLIPDSVLDEIDAVADKMNKETARFGFGGTQDDVTTGRKEALVKSAEVLAKRDEDVSKVRAEQEQSRAENLAKQDKAVGAAQMAAAATRTAAEFRAAMTKLTTSVNLPAEALERIKEASNKAGAEATNGVVSKETALEGLKAVVEQEITAFKATPEGQAGEALAGDVRLPEKPGDVAKVVAEETAEPVRGVVALQSKMADTLRGFSSAALRAASAPTRAFIPLDIAKKQLDVAEKQLKSLEKIERNSTNPTLVTFK